MCSRRTFIIVTVIGVLALASGVAALVYWLVADTSDFSIIELEGDGFQDVEQKAAFTQIRGAGDMFWWFYPSESSATSKPIVLWLDGVTGLPPSLLANFGMFGPLDFNLNKRNDSWVDEYNLLFVDAPIGTGFSTARQDNRIPSNLQENTEHLLFTLESFYTLHENFTGAPLYIFGQAQGAQMALSLAIRLLEAERIVHNLQGVVLANAIISPAQVLAPLGFYLEELGYIDANGRSAIEAYSQETLALVNRGQLREAYSNFLSLGDFVNEQAGAVAVNLGYIVEKMTREPATRDYFGQRSYLRNLLPTEVDLNEFMAGTVAPALGIRNAAYDSRRDAAVQAFRDSFMAPAIDKVEHILENTTLSVAIYNGNLDAVSNTPGQLEWINNLQWSGQAAFLNSPRQTLVVNGLVEGYFKETNRLKFYWMNAAGQSVPLDSPTAMRRVLRRITATD